MNPLATSLVLPAMYCSSRDCPGRVCSQLDRALLLSPVLRLWLLACCVAAWPIAFRLRDCESPVDFARPLAKPARHAFTHPLTPTPPQVAMRATLALLALLALLLAPSATRAHDDEYSFGALKPRAASDPSPLCTGCQALVDASYDATQNATVMADLLAAMQAGCVNASSPILCDLIADAIVKLLPKLPEKIYDVKHKHKRHT